MFVLICNEHSKFLSNFGYDIRFQIETWISYGNDLIDPTGLEGNKVSCVFYTYNYCYKSWSWSYLLLQPITVAVLFVKYIILRFKSLLKINNYLSKSEIKYYDHIFNISLYLSIRIWCE